MVSNTIDSRMSEVLATFRQAKEMEDAGMEYLTYKALIDEGKKLEPLPEEARTEENLVTKCTSTVHMTGQVREGKVHYLADSDAAFVRGELGLLLGIFNDLPAEAVVSRETEQRFSQFFEELRRYVAISMNRTQGFFGMFEKMREIALKYTACAAAVAFLWVSF